MNQNVWKVNKQSSVYLSYCIYNQDIWGVDRKFESINLFPIMIFQQSQHGLVILTPFQHSTHAIAPPPRRLNSSCWKCWKIPLENKF